MAIERILNDEINVAATILTNFGEGSNDVVMLRIYDMSDNYQFSAIVDRNDWYVNDRNSETTINYEKALAGNGITTGTYKVRTYLLRTAIESIGVAEISNDFKELRLTKDAIGENDPIGQNVFDGLINDSLSLHQTYDNQIFSLPLIVYEAQDIPKQIINIVNDADDSLCIKLLRPFESEPASITVATLMADIRLHTITISPPAPQEPFQWLQPNFALNYDFAKAEPTVEKTWDDLLGSDTTTSQQLISKYISQSYGEGIELNIDYDNYHDFVHFSSAEERLRNFHWKMTKIEEYRSDIADLKALSGGGAQTSGNISTTEKKIDNLLHGFDGYERHLYYNSGSTYTDTSNAVTYIASTWPKYNNTKPYCNMSSSHADVKRWYGSTVSTDTYYGGQINSASIYDAYNNDMLIKSLPSFIIQDSQNQQIFTWMHMLGHHYDILFNYVKHLTSIHSREESVNLGTPKDMLYDIANSLGIQLFNGNVSEDLWMYALGTNQTGTQLQTGLGTGSGSLQSFSGKDRTSEIWNRLINNLPLLMKSKGTERSLRALINCYGIPSSVLRIVEFGGPDLQGENQQFAINRYANALKFYGSDYLKKSFDKIDQYHYRGQDQYPNTIQLRIKTDYKQNQILLSKNDNDFGLLLEHSASAHESYQARKSPYGRLKFFISGSTYLSCSTDWAPLYDNDWWNVMIRRQEITGSSLHAEQVLQPTTYDIYAKKAGDHSDGRITHTVNASTEIISGSAQGNGAWMSGSVDTFHIGKAVSWGDDVPTEVSNPWPATKGFSGSMQEYREWITRLSVGSFDQHIQNPQCIVGNNYSSSYYDLICRLPLGTNLVTHNHAIRKEISGSHPRYKVHNFSSIGNGISISSASAVGFATDVNDYEDVEEVYYINMPSTVGSRPISNKVRIEKNDIPKHMGWSGEMHTHLSPETRKEFSAFDIAPIDTNKLGIYLSPTNDINIDIANNIGQTRLDAFVGDPRDASKYEYEELRKIRKEYFQKYEGKKDLWDYIRQVEFFDGTLFQILKKFVPEKSNELTGLLIEPPILERPKLKRAEIGLTEETFRNPTTIGYKYHTTSSVDPFISSSGYVVSGENIIHNAMISSSGIYNISASQDMHILIPSGSPYEMAIVATLYPCKIEGHDIMRDGSRYIQTQVVTHKGVDGYTQGSMSIQLSPASAREVTGSLILNSRKSQVYKSKKYYYTTNSSASKHMQFLRTGEWRGPYEYSRDSRSPMWIPSMRSYNRNGQFGNDQGSYRFMAHSSSMEYAETNIEDNTGCQKLSFEGSQLIGTDINKPTKTTPDGGPVVSYFETNPNQLFAAADSTANKGDLLLSGELTPAQNVSQMGGSAGDKITGYQQPGPQGQQNGYWLNTGTTMVWITIGAPGTIFGAPGKGNTGRNPYGKTGLDRN